MTLEQLAKEQLRVSRVHYLGRDAFNEAGIPALVWFNPLFQNPVRCQYKAILSDEELFDHGLFDLAYPAEEEPLAEAEYGVLTDSSFFAISHVVGYESIIRHLLDCSFGEDFARQDLKDRFFLEAVAPLAYLRIAGHDIACCDMDNQRVIAAAQRLRVQYDKYHSFEAKAELLAKR